VSYIFILLDKRNSREVEINEWDDLKLKKKDNDIKS